MTFMVETGRETRVELLGRLDTRSAPALMDELDSLRGQDIERIVFECSGLTYLSSAGIRVILFARENIREGMTVRIENAAESVMEVISMVGLDEFVELG